MLVRHIAHRLGRWFGIDRGSNIRRNTNVPVRTCTPPLGLRGSRHSQQKRLLPPDWLFGHGVVKLGLLQVVLTNNTCELWSECYRRYQLYFEDSLTYELYVTCFPDPDVRWAPLTSRVRYTPSATAAPKATDADFIGEPPANFSAQTFRTSSVENITTSNKT